MYAAARPLLREFRMNDKELVQGCIDGNYRAQRELYNHFSPKMMGICLRYAANRSEAEDILQDGFIKVFRKIDTYTAKGPLGAWIRRIIVNTAAQSYRDSKNLRLSTDLDQVDFFLESNDNVIESLSARELISKIMELPTGYRVVFNLYAVEGFTHPEIAEKLGISSGTSKSQYSRARAMLRKMIEEEEAYSGQVG
jgi:RNA polymerase sigma factor (sigma-70 family)